MAGGTFSRITGMTHSLGYSNAVNGVGGQKNAGYNSQSNSSEEFKGMLDSNREKKKKETKDSDSTESMPVRRIINSKGNRQKINPQLMNLIKQKQFQMNERIKDCSNNDTQNNKKNLEESSKKENNKSATSVQNPQQWRKLLETASETSKDINEKINNELGRKL